MNFRLLFLMCVSLTLLGCAGQRQHKSEVTGRQDKTEVKNEACEGKVAPDIACSHTVTSVFDAKGRLWLAWVNKEHVYVQSSADKGKTLSAPVRVNKIAEPIIAHGEYRPKIQLDKQGNIYLSWTRSLEKRHTGHIRFSRSLDGGNSFSDPVTINDNQDVISHRFDSLLVGENGELFIAWLDARDKVKASELGEEFLGTSLYYAWSDDQGETFQTNQLLAPHTCECCRLGTAIDKDNLPVVIWRHVFPGGIRDHALLKFKDWRTPGELKRLSSEDWKIDACPHHGPALAIAEDGTYHAAWFSGVETKPGLFYAHTKDQGSTYAGAMQFGGQGASHPHLAVLGQDVAIVWLEFDGSSTLVQLIRSFDGGQTWSEPRQIGKSMGSADYAFVVASEDSMYLSWQNSAGYELILL